MSVNLVEPGSLDIEAVNIRLDIVDIDTPAALLEMSDDILKRGNKFVVAEHFVDPDGNPLEGIRFDAASMCYSLFAQKVGEGGRHSQIVDWIRKSDIRGRIGRIVGGGMIQVKPGYKLAVHDTSAKYGAVPPFLRHKWAQLLIDREKSNGIELGHFVTPKRLFCGVDRLNPHWFRFRQVLEGAKERLNPTEHNETLAMFIADQQKEWNGGDGNNDNKNSIFKQNLSFQPATSPMGDGGRREEEVYLL